MAALAAAARRPDFPAVIALVLADRPEAAGLVHAADAGIATATIHFRDYRGDRPGFESAIDARLGEAGIEIVCLAGFMRLLSGWFVSRWAGRLLNIHPSLLPAFKGLDTHARALAAGATEHGCTVHLVTEELDAGPILAQARVSVLPDDTAATLAARVLREEHRLYPSALADFVRGRHRAS
jgi:formyltetrahydrofolate-dependent phosphoribosylglycinamide formyltransferase